MNLSMTLANQISQHWGEFLLLGIGVWLMYRKGIKTADDRLVALQKETIGELNARITTLSEKLEVQGKELAGLQATLVEKDKKLNEYLEIINGRDPTTQKIQEMAVKYMENTGTILTEIHNYIKEHGVTKT